VIARSVRKQDQQRKALGFQIQMGNPLQKSDSQEPRVQDRLRSKFGMDNFSCSHRCLLSQASLVRGTLVLVTPARPAAFTCFVSLASYLSCGFPCPNSAPLCTSGPFLHLLQSRGELSFLPRPEEEVVRCVSLESSDETCQKLC
jgi:hypothetical protein